MTTCWSCGGEIVFRTVDGVLRPIHLDGPWCLASGSSSEIRLNAKYDSVESYLNPNARCPVCGGRVYFYQSPHGGRVFFDDVGWPWPKHPCTDKLTSELDDELSPLPTQRYAANFKNLNDEIMDIWLISRTSCLGGTLLVDLFERQDSATAQMKVGLKFLERNSIHVDDIAYAPSFLSKRKVPAGPRKVVGFICGSKKEIVHMEVELLITKKGRATRY